LLYSLDQTQEEHARNPFMHYQAVTPGYLRAMGIPLVAGRDLHTGDDADAPPVIVVSRALAEQSWPGEDPIGRRLKLGGPDSPAPWMTVVGVTGAVRYRGLEEPSLTAYMPYRQANSPLNHLIVRAEGEPTAVVRAVRDEIRAVDPAARAVEVATVGELDDGFLDRPRFQTALLGLFGILALLLGAVGTYGVLAFAVSRRRREFAVRLAIGAEARDLIGDVLRRAGSLILAGIGIGLAATLLATRVIQGLLFGVSAVEPVV
jgi:putative ABC transport system permease protein